MDKAVAQGRRRCAKVGRDKTKARAGAPDYERDIVTFIDVLGFRAMLTDRPAGRNSRYHSFAAGIHYARGRELSSHAGSASFESSIR